jgi:formamidopyrimidine-DNA glycosylase
MPELPEVEVTRLQLKPYLEGQQIQSVMVGDKQLRYPYPETLYDWQPVKLNELDRVGKYLIFKFGHGNLYWHFGMTGHLRIEPIGTILKKHDHVVVQTEFHAIHYHDPRRFGFMIWQDLKQPVPDGVQRLGKDPMKGLEIADINRLCDTNSKMIKSQLLNQSLITGIGNIYACESLFLANIHPKKIASKMSDQEKERLMMAIDKTLKLAISKGGSSLKDFKSPLGNIGYFPMIARVYNRNQQPCSVCQTLIKKIVIEQRSTFFCENCQV